MAEYGFLKRKSGFGTKSVHAGQDPDSWPAADLVTPICISALYKQVDLGVSKAGFGYNRFGNPTRNALERALADLADAKHCLTFPSGMSALVTLAHTLSAGDHVLLSGEVYGGSGKYIVNVASRLGIENTYFDALDLSTLASAIKPNTRMVWLESPTNPIIKVVDIREVCRIVHELRPDVIVAVDNTFMTSYMQKPLELGADIAAASLTKYYNGHGDVLMGAICLNNDELFARIAAVQKTIGTVTSPFECAFVHRSLRTLPLRMDKHMKNGIAVARFLEAHPRIKKVMHPMLDSYPKEMARIARSQSYGHCGILAFSVDGTEAQVRAFLLAVRLFTLAGSVGDVGSIIACPVKMIDLTEFQKRDVDSYNHQLIRMSVGVEDAEDLIADLENALKVAFEK